MSEWKTIRTAEHDGVHEERREDPFRIMPMSIMNYLYQVTQEYHLYERGNVWMKKSMNIDELKTLADSLYGQRLQDYLYALRAQSANLEKKIQEVEFALSI